MYITSKKTYFHFEPYLNIPINYKHRSVITKFRVTAHILKVKIGRYQKIPKEDLYPL